MSVTYKFNNLQSLADYFANAAARYRDEANHPKTKPGKRRQLSESAFELESVVHVIRNTVIEEVKPR